MFKPVQKQRDLIGKVVVSCLSLFGSQYVSISEKSDPLAPFIQQPFTLHLERPMVGAKGK